MASRTAVTIVEPQPSGAMTVTTPSHLLAMAVQQGADLDKLEKLMQLQERWEAGEARKAFVAAMAQFKAEPIDIRKGKSVGYHTKEGDFVGYKHATTADVVDAVVPAMGKHGLSHNWQVKQDGGQVIVTCTITHMLGHSESVQMQAAPDNSGKKNAIQQVASTVQYLQRYTLMAACGVAAKEMDDDGRGFESAEDEPEVDQKDADWIRVADQLDDPIEYKAQREKMLKDYGGVNHMPINVRNAFNAAKARVTPKDVE